MPSVTINSSNINTFSWAANVNIQERVIIFDTSASIYNNINSVLGICFSVIDSAGIEVAGVDWNNPQIIPSASQTCQIDLSSFPINFLFQNYQLIGFIKDADGMVYSTTPVLKAISQPVGINESGYVDGLFSVVPDCINNILTVKEFTVFVYNNLIPITVTKSGTLYFPVGTIAPISFTGTPFSNNVVYSGTHRINCTSTATYDLGDNITVSVTYYTDHEFPVVCSNFMGDITCCLSDVYNTYLKNCDNSIGQAALQKYNAAFLPFSLGFLKQINGQDASEEVIQIKKILNCNCGSTSVRQNEISPTSSSNYSIVLQGQGGTTVLPAYMIGSTKVYNIASSSYVVGKADLGDAAFAVKTDTSTPNVVKYLISFNYDSQALANLNAIAADPSLINQLNSLITASGGSIQGLNGGCVIDLTKANYSVSQEFTSSTVISNIVINGTAYLAPTNLFANNTVSLTAWLNSLTLGTFTANISGSTLTIQSVNNTNTISTISFGSPSVVKMFASTSATLLQVLQAVIDYICGLSDAQVSLASNLNLCTFDYNGNIVQTGFSAGTDQSVFNAGVASAICNIISRIQTLSSVTCNTFKTIFVDAPNVIFGVSDRIYGTLGGNCAGLTDQQIANMVIAAVGKYSDVKTAWCAINCNATPTCPDISNVSLAMSGSNIGLYGLTWNTSTLASQNVTVKYRVSGTLTWSVATNALTILPNGSISGSSPYLITGLTTGTTYDVYVQNNCGGTGFIKQITTPTGSVYTGNYNVENTIYAICGASPIILYSANPFGAGTRMYTDVGMTTPLTGYTYITKNGSNIFAIDTTSGIVGADTGSSCANGVSGSYILGNSTSTICAGTPVTLYTNGAFAVGSILYTDASLINPQTGYSYVVDGSHSIYNLNSGTGAVGSSTGLNCNNYLLSASYNFSINSVSGAGVPTLPATPINGSQSGSHGAMSGSYSVVLSGTVVTTTKLDALVNGTVVYCVPVTSAGTYTLNITATATDSVVIAVDSGAC